MKAASLLAVLFLAVPQEDPPSRVTLFEETLGEDAYFDLDTGTALSHATAGNVTADFQFARRDGSLKLVPLGGALFAVLPFQTLDAFPESIDLSKLSGEPIELEKNFALVGRTSEGKVFKASVTLSWLLPREVVRNPFPTRPPSVSLEGAVQQNGRSRIPSRVKGLRVRAARIDWEGGAKEKFRVRWVSERRDVVGTSIELKDLAKDKIYRVEVTRLLENGGEGEPAIASVFSTPTGPERHVMEATRPRNQDYRINLCAGEPDEIDPDWIAGPGGVRVPEGGAIQWLGEGEALFESTSELPEYGYAARLERFQTSDVFAIRLRDGRFVKVFVRPQWDMRDGIRLEYVYLKGGGRRIEPGPRGLEGAFEGMEVKLKWKAVEGVEVGVFLRSGDAVRELGRTHEGTFAWDAPEKRAFVLLAVATIDRDGVRSDFSTIEVATVAVPFRAGTFTLASKSKNGFDFAAQKIVESGEGDVLITSGLGQNRTLTVRGPHGMAGAGTLDEFGKIDPGRLRSLLKELYSGSIDLNPRLPGRAWFRVKSAEGGLAHVRLLEGDLAQAKFQYVYLPHPDYATMLDELTTGVKPPAEKEAAEIRKLIEALDSEKIDDREEAQEALLTRRAAASLIDEARKKSTSVEQKTRLEALVRELWERLP